MQTDHARQVTRVVDLYRPSVSGPSARRDGNSSLVDVAKPNLAEGLAKEVFVRVCLEGRRSLRGTLRPTSAKERGKIAGGAAVDHRSSTMTVPCSACPRGREEEGCNPMEMELQ